MFNPKSNKLYKIRFPVDAWTSIHGTISRFPNAKSDEKGGVLRKRSAIVTKEIVHRYDELNVKVLEKKLVSVLESLE